MYIRVKPYQIIPIFILLILSCASLKTDPELISGPAGPFSEFILSPYEVKNLLIERDKDFHGLKALGKFKIEEKEKGNQSFDGILFFEKPDKLRIQGMSLGAVLFDVIMKNKESYLYLPSERSISKIEDDNIKYLEQIFAMIPPYTPLIKCMREKPILFVERASENYIVYLGKENGTLLKKVWLDKGYLLPIREEIYNPEGSKSVEIAFSNFKEVEDGWYPYRIVINDPNKGFKLRIDIQKIIINPAFNKTDFEFPDKIIE